MKSVLTIILLISFLHAGAQKHILIPDFAVVQYAGSIGFVNGGVGYDLFENRGRLSGHFGMVPKSEGGPLTIVAVKAIGEPWTIRASEKTTINPLDIGMMVSYHIGDDFKTNVPDLLASRNYYWWHTSLRVHLITETSVSVDLEPDRLFRKLTAYAEFNSNDLYMVSYLANASTLRLHELFKLGVGMRFNF